MKFKVSIFLGLIIFTNVLCQNQTKIKGFVFDHSTNEKLTQVIISSSNMYISSTDSNGYFEFKYNNYRTLKFRLLGYNTKEVKIENNKFEDIELFVYLKKDEIELESITVLGEKFKRNKDYTIYDLTPYGLNNIPVFLESDVQRALQTLPGITSSHDFNSQVFIRGGNFDETKISLDNVAILNPNHVGGIFGIMNPDVLSEVKVFPSNYPLDYSGYISGIVEMKSKQGNAYKTKGKAAVGLLTSKLFLETSLFNGGLLVSARRTYLDLLNKISFNFPYNFYDIYLKYSKNVLGLTINSSLFYSKDRYKAFHDGRIVNEKERPNWGNLLGNISLEKVLGNLIINVQGYYTESYFDSDVTGFSENMNSELEHIIVKNLLNEKGVKINTEYLTEGHELNIGAEYKTYETNYSWDINEHYFTSLLDGNFETVFFDNAPQVYKSADKIEIGSIYLTDKIYLTRDIEVILGLRGLYSEKTDTKKLYPYASAKYNFNKSLFLTLGFGKYYQFIHAKKESIASTIFSPFPVYFLPQSKKNILESEHYHLRLRREGIFGSIDFDFGIYYKERKNIPTLKSDTKTFIYSTGYAYGLDFLLEKKKGDFTGWLNYSISKSVKKNEKYKYYAPYDRTHNFKLMLSYNLNSHWKINCYWFAATGLPFTPMLGKYTDGNNWKVYYGKINSARYSLYHRMDLGISGKFIWNKIILKPYLQVMNAYNSSNPFNYEANPSATTLEANTERSSYVVPTIGISVEF